MTNARAPSGSAGARWYAAMCERGGASRGSASTKASTAADAPSARISTPAEVLRTQPPTPWLCASE